MTDRIDQGLAALTVNMNCHSDVTLQVPVGNKFSQSGLVDPRRLPTHGGASQPKEVNN